MPGLRRVMSVVILAGLQPLCVGCHRGASIVAHERAPAGLGGTCATVLRRITDPSPGFRVAVDHSWIEVRTPAIDAVVAEGPSMLPTIIERMRDPDVGFDEFARLFSCADQILRRVDPDLRLWWRGGCRVNLQEQRLAPASQRYDHEFREAVIRAIEQGERGRISLFVPSSRFAVS